MSATTRAQRPGEVDGVHYHFLGRPEFERRKDGGEFLEWVDYVGNLYGTLTSEIDRLRSAGRAPLLELETEGALRVKRRAPESVTFFVTAPNNKQKHQQHKQTTESSGVIEDRLAVAHEQLQQAGDFDHVIENRSREDAADELAAIVARRLAAAATMAP